MHKFLIYLLSLVILPVFAYEVYNPNNYTYNNDSENLLFVVDFSNSMGEFLNHKTKVDQVKRALTVILPQISKDTKTGIRVYGHTCNMFAYNACRSSELLVPLAEDNSSKILHSIEKLHPRGMTPITYSLKQAVNKDFRNNNEKKHIILLTDGGENCDESPCEYTISLIKERKDISIDVIAFNVGDEADLAQLKCTANVTGGNLSEANTSAELLDSMQKFTAPHKKVEATLYGLH
ncbi:MAG: VWA domain-containing protein [bacterium]|nr:VWA domain-containing protein [bacterium]